MALLNIGFGNLVEAAKIVAIISPDSAPAKRRIAEAKKSGEIIDATQGRKTRSVIFMESGCLVLSAVLPETIYARSQEGEPL